MGVGITADLWPMRPLTAGVLLLHSVGGIPDNVRSGLPVQVHLADPDRFGPADEVAAWQAAAARLGISAEIFKYPGIGHLYTDTTLPDYDAEAAERTWNRIIDFLGAL